MPKNNIKIVKGKVEEITTYDPKGNIKTLFVKNFNRGISRIFVVGKDMVKEIKETSNNGYIIKIGE